MPDFIDKLTLTVPGTHDPVFAVDLNGNMYLKGQLNTPMSQDLFENGSAAAPSIAFTGSTTTGFYYDSTNAAIGASVAGVSSFEVRTAGIVLRSTQYLGWSPTDLASGNADVRLSRGTAAVLFGNSADSNNRIDIGALASPVQNIFVGTSFVLGVNTNTTGTVYIGANASQSLTMDVAGTGVFSTLSFSVSRGTQAARSNSSSGDIIGIISAKAYAGSVFSTAAINFYVDGAVTTAQSPPSRISFLTNTINAGNVEYLRIDQMGNIITNLSGADLVQGATAAFIHIPGCATGKPNGTPTPLYTGAYPFVWDHVNKKISVYDGGWLQSAALS